MKNSLFLASEGNVIACVRSPRRGGFFLHPARNMPRERLRHQRQQHRPLSLPGFHLAGRNRRDFHQRVLAGAGYLRGRHPVLVHHFRLLVRPVGDLRRTAQAERQQKLKYQGGAVSASPYPERLVACQALSPTANGSHKSRVLRNPENPPTPFLPIKPSTIFQEISPSLVLIR